MTRSFRHFLFATLALVPFVGMAEETIEQKLAACAREADDVARLACFNAVAAVVAAPAIDPVVPSPTDAALEPPTSGAAPAPRLEVIRDAEGRLNVSGEWVVLRSTDSMTDKPRVTLFTDGTMEVGRANGHPSLILRCFDRRLEAYAKVNAYVGTRDTFATQVRFDAMPPVMQRWSGSTTGTFVFSPAPAAFTNRLATASNLLMEVTGFNGEHYRMAFDLKGLDVALREITACWRPPAPVAAPARPTVGPSRPAGPPRT